MPRGARLAVGLVCALLPAGAAFGWGYTAHRIVAENAAARVPSPMAAYYASRAREVSDASVEPDRVLKVRDGEEERRRHYINLDRIARPPFDDLPATEAAARARYGDRRVDDAGTLPWRCVECVARLTVAFREGDTAGVVRLSGWLSHYVADAFQPLHATSDYDGRQSGHDGIHKAFEAELIHRKRRDYRRLAAPGSDWEPRHIDAPFATLLGVLAESFDLVSRVFEADTRASGERGGTDDAYYERLEADAGPIAATRLRLATELTVDLWYTAWVDAGRPAFPVDATEAPP